MLEFSALKKVFDADLELRDHCIIVVSNSSISLSSYNGKENRLVQFQNDEAG